MRCPKCYGIYIYKKQDGIRPKAGAGRTVPGLSYFVKLPIYFYFRSRETDIPNDPSDLQSNGEFLATGSFSTRLAQTEEVRSAAKLENRTKIQVLCVDDRTLTN